MVKNLRNQINTVPKFVVVGIIITILGCYACNSKQVYNEKTSIDNATWSKDSPITFSYTVPDTITQYTLQVTVENTNDYMYSNLFLFSTITFPDSLTIRDTLECMLANYKGEWTGKGWWGYSNEFNFKHNIRFPKPGTYTFSFEQAMRCTNKSCELTGIKSIGFRIIRL
jgi:gliding motility-associated lipoprotein GldH